MKPVAPKTVTTCPATDDLPPIIIGTTTTTTTATILSIAMGKQ